jgi:hypothetical protein
LFTELVGLLSGCSILNVFLTLRDVRKDQVAFSAIVVHDVSSFTVHDKPALLEGVLHDVVSSLRVFRSQSLVNHSVLVLLSKLFLVKAWLVVCLHVKDVLILLKVGALIVIHDLLFSLLKNEQN